MARRKTSKSESSVADLGRVLGHTFERPELLLLALTHRSFVFDAGGVRGTRLTDPSQDNEQLEFMGDAVLGLLVAEALCRRFPASREGELTQMRASLVSRKHLGDVGTRLELGRWLRLGATTDDAGGRANAAMISNAMEAVIAALYLDGGLETARGFVEREVMAGVEWNAAGLPGTLKDFKTALQELVQAESLGRVIYGAAGESGPAHRRTFRVEVRLEGAGAEFGLLAEAEGSTKKQAQQEAARLAIEALRGRGFEKHAAAAAEEKTA